MRSDFRAGERKMVKRKTPNFFRNQAFLAEDEGFDCQFANGKLYGDDQFLNWSLPQSTGLACDLSRIFLPSTFLITKTNDSDDFFVSVKSSSI